MGRTRIATPLTSVTGSQWQLRGLSSQGFQDRPVMSCCGARNPPLAVRSQDFDRCHSFLLAVSAPGGARKRPRFGKPPCRGHYTRCRRLLQVGSGGFPVLCGGFFRFPTPGRTRRALPLLVDSRSRKGYSTEENRRREVPRWTNISCSAIWRRSRAPS